MRLCRDLERDIQRFIFEIRDLRLMLVDQVGEIYRDLQRNIQRFTVRYRDLWLMLVDRALNSFVDYIFLLSWI